MDIRGITDKVASEYYARIKYVPPEMKLSFMFRQNNPEWSKLREHERQKYRDIVAPIIKDTLNAAGLEDVA